MVLSNIGNGVEGAGAGSAGAWTPPEARPCLTTATVSALLEAAPQAPAPGVLGSGESRSFPWMLNSPHVGRKISQELPCFVRCTQITRMQIQTPAL